MTATATTRSHGPSAAQREYIKTAVTKDLRRICEAWPVAEEESQTLVYGETGVGAGNGESDVFITSDDTAELWLADARPTLALILRLSDTSHVRHERQWTGPFYPPRLVESLCAAVCDLVDLWPVRIQALWARIAKLASVAAKHWPPTPKKGTVIDGVKVGDRGNTADICTECKSPIGGNAADPLARIDGKPYHRTPCYNTVKRRAARKSGPVGYRADHDGLATFDGDKMSDGGTA